MPGDGRAYQRPGRLGVPGAAQEVGLEGGEVGPLAVGGGEVPDRLEGSPGTDGGGSEGGGAGGPGTGFAADARQDGGQEGMARSATPQETVRERDEGLQPILWS